MLAVMYIPWRVREYERTCPAGHTWRAPAWAVHPRMRGLPFSPVMQRGTGAQGFGRTGEVIAANAQLAERAAAFDSCPQCGDDRHRQRAIRG
jgi:hypothetical protein